MTAVQRAEVLGQLGLCELEQREFRDAAEHLARSLERDADLNRALLGRFTRAFDKAVEHVGQIYVGVSPPDAEILLDGRTFGTGASALVLFVEPGIHTVRARLSGHVDAHQIIEVAVGQKQTAMMQLSREVEARAPAPKANASTKGASSAQTPARARAPGPWVGWPGKLRTAGIALTTATLSVGGLFMIRASVLDGDIHERIDGLNDQPGWNSGSCLATPQPDGCSELHHLNVARDLYAAMGTGLVATGGVVGAVTVVSFFTDFSFLRSKPARAGFTVVPAVTAHQAGLVALGVW